MDLSIEIMKRGGYLRHGKRQLEDIKGRYYALKVVGLGALRI